MKRYSAPITNKKSTIQDKKEAAPIWSGKIQDESPKSSAETLGKL